LFYLQWFDLLLFNLFDRRSLTGLTSGGLTGLTSGSLTGLTGGLFIRWTVD
jgi:hypothetical protein